MFKVTRLIPDEVNPGLLLRDDCAHADAPLDPANVVASLQGVQRFVIMRMRYLRPLTFAPVNCCFLRRMSTCSRNVRFSASII